MCYCINIALVFGVFCFFVAPLKLSPLMAHPANLGKKMKGVELGIQVDFHSHAHSFNIHV